MLHGIREEEKKANKQEGRRKKVEERKKEDYSARGKKESKGRSVCRDGRLIQIEINIER